MEFKSLDENRKKLFKREMNWFTEQPLAKKTNAAASPRAATARAPPTATASASLARAAATSPTAAPAAEPRRCSRAGPRTPSGRTTARRASRRVRTIRAGSRRTRPRRTRPRTEGSGAGAVRGTGWRGRRDGAGGRARVGGCSIHHAVRSSTRGSSTACHRHAVRVSGGTVRCARVKKRCWRGWVLCCVHGRVWAHRSVDSRNYMPDAREPSFGLLEKLSIER